jgi:hypothetical protein
MDDNRYSVASLTSLPLGPQKQARRTRWQCVFLCYRARLSWCFRLLLLLRLEVAGCDSKGRSRAHVLFALLYEREMRTEFGGAM